MSDEPRPVHRRKMRGQQISAIDLVTPAPPWTPNWIDYRASRARIDRRVDAGELPERCVECYCEVDIVPAPHSPKCSERPS
jgi:hypothetical protein